MQMVSDSPTCTTLIEEVAEGQRKFRGSIFKCFMCVDNYDFIRLTFGIKLPKYNLSYD